MRVKSLPDSPDYGFFLFCRHCRGEFSATRGDYFLSDPDKRLRCHGADLLLMRRITLYERVTVPVKVRA